MRTKRLLCGAKALRSGLSRRGFLHAAGFAACAFTLTAAPMAQAESHMAAKKGGILNVALETDVRGFDTVEGGVLGQTGETVIRTMMEPLLGFDDASGESTPLLATEWSADEAQTVWTFKLREGVKFHDGSDFDAQDVAAHYNRILDPEAKSASRSFLTAIKEVKVVDPLTVEFHLAHPWQALLPYLATTSMSGPIPPSEHVAAGKQNREPVGTGPFKFVSWASGDRIIVEKWDGYRNVDETNLDGINFRILPDTQTRYASMKSGEVDVIWTDRGTTIVEAQKDDDIVSMYSDGGGASTMLLNSRKPPLDDVRVRQAVASAMNQPALVKIIWQDTRPVVTHPLGQLKDCGKAGYRDYDPKAAKALIDDYGQPVKIVMIHTATPRGRELGELMQQMMKPAGIELELQPVDQSTLVKRVFTQDFGISGWRIADGADIGPQIFVNIFSKSSYNLTGFSSPELDAKAMAMRTSKDRDERLQLQCDLIQAINEDGSMLYWGGGRYWAFTTKRVKGVPAPYRGVVDVTRAWIDE